MITTMDILTIFNMSNILLTITNSSLSEDYDFIKKTLLGGTINDSTADFLQVSHVRENGKRTSIISKEYFEYYSVLTEEINEVMKCELKPKVTTTGSRYCPYLECDASYNGSLIKKGRTSVIAFIDKDTLRLQILLVTHLHHPAFPERYPLIVDYITQHGLGTSVSLYKYF